MDRVPSRSEVEKVLSRDDFTCRTCGFVSKKFQRVIAHENANGFVTTCTFCEMTQALDRAGFMGAGLLIWLPEMTQVELNHVARALYVARVSETKLAAPATRTLEVLTSRRTDAKKRLGSDDPLLLATALTEEVDEKTYVARAEKLEGIRLLPLDRYVMRHGGADVNIFGQMIAYWLSPEGPFGQRAVEEWVSLFDDVSTKTAAAG